MGHWWKQKVFLEIRVPGGSVVGLGGHCPEWGRSSVTKGHQWGDTGKARGSQAPEGRSWLGQTASAASLCENSDCLLPTPGLLLTTDVRPTWSRTLDPSPSASRRQRDVGGRKGSRRAWVHDTRIQHSLSLSTPCPGANPVPAQRFPQELPSWSPRSPCSKDSSRAGLGSPYCYETSF